MLDFVKRNAERNCKGKLAAQERKHPRTTVTGMRDDLITRAQATIKAINAYEGGKLKSPMAHSIQNGIEVNIGYGKGNTRFYEGPKESRALIIPEFVVPRSRKILAVEYLQDAIASLQAGEFDGLLSKALADMKSKFPKREDAPKQEEPEGQLNSAEVTPNNVTHMPKAA